MAETSTIDIPINVTSPELRQISKALSAIRRFDAVHQALVECYAYIFYAERAEGSLTKEQLRYLAQEALRD